LEAESSNSVVPVLARFSLHHIMADYIGMGTFVREKDLME
jgi:hypothetical protein